MSYSIIFHILSNELSGLPSLKLIHMHNSYYLTLRKIYVCLKPPHLHNCVQAFPVFAYREYFVYYTYIVTVVMSCNKILSTTYNNNIHTYMTSNGNI